MSRSPEPDSAPTAAHPHGGILSLACGHGKCLKFDTPIMMADGRVKMVQDVRVGDALMGDDMADALSLCFFSGL